MPYPMYFPLCWRWPFFWNPYGWRWPPAPFHWNAHQRIVLDEPCPMKSAIFTDAFHQVIRSFSQSFVSAAYSWGRFTIPRQLYTATHTGRYAIANSTSTQMGAGEARQIMGWFKKVGVRILLIFTCLTSSRLMCDGRETNNAIEMVNTETTPLEFVFLIYNALFNCQGKIFLRLTLREDIHCEINGAAAGKTDGSFERKWTAKTDTITQKVSGRTQEFIDHKFTFLLPAGGWRRQ